MFAVELLRLRDRAGERRLAVRAGGSNAGTRRLRATDHAPEAAVAEEPSLRLVNDTDREQLFILERTGLGAIRPCPQPR